MNKQIQELFWKAFWNAGPGATLYTEPPMRQVTGVKMSFESADKLVELIVRECAEVALREDHDPADCILNHFGLLKNET